MSAWLKSNCKAVLIVILLLSVVVFGVWYHWEQARKVNALCGGGELNARAAVGNTDKLLEGPAMGSFIQERPRCLKVAEIQTDSLPRAPFFYDNARGPNCHGRDGDLKDGIDVAPLFFFVSHGDSEKWYTSGGEVKYNCMELGNEAGGALRYYWQCSCQAFAHGQAKEERKTYSDFSQPWKFVGSALRDSPKQPNAFMRWGPVIGSGLRLACGPSTISPCRYGQIQRIWMNMQSRLGVSVSFIEGLYNGPGSAPLCITRAKGSRGQPVPELSPLSDKVFVAAKRSNVSPSDFYFIEYPRPLATKPIADRADRRDLPVVSLEEQQTGVGYQFEGGPWYRRWLDSWRTWNIRKSDLRFYENRSVKMTDLRARCPEDSKCKSDDWFIERAKRFVSRSGWDEFDLGPPEGFRILVDSALVEHGKEIFNFQKGVVVRFRRIVVKDKPLIYEDDSDGNIVILMNNDGLVANAWKLWLPVGKIKRDIKFTDKDLESLREVAAGKLERDRGGYELADFDFVYKRIDGELTPAVVFHAEPIQGKNLIDFPPKQIEVPLDAKRR